MQAEINIWWSSLKVEKLSGINNLMWTIPLKLIEKNTSPTVAEIIRPVCTLQNVRRLKQDAWVMDMVRKYKRNNSQKSTVGSAKPVPRGVKSEVRNIDMKSKGDSRMLKLCVEIEDIQIEKAKKLVAELTSDTVADVLDSAITEENIVKALNDAWIQEKLLDGLANITCNKKNNQLEETEKVDDEKAIKLKDLLTIKRFRVKKVENETETQ